MLFTHQVLLMMWCNFFPIYELLSVGSTNASINGNDVRGYTQHRGVAK